MLKTFELTKQYRGRTVVQGVSLELQRGRVVGLLGPNGAGKTTTFYMVVGLVRPDSGRVELNGMDISSLPVYRRARRGLGYLPQEPSIFRKLTVEDNLLLVLDNIRMTRQEKRAKAEAALVELGLSHLAGHRAHTLSGGERRRLEIARALILRPEFLLLDEPYAGIDPIAVQEIQGIIRRLRQKEIGVIITDHNVRETLSTCDEAYLIKSGQIWVHGSPQDIVQNEGARKFYLGEDFVL